MRKFKEFMLTEAINTSNAARAAHLIQTFLSRKLNKKVGRMPGVEQYKSAGDRGFGIRYFFDGKSIRFNWTSAGMSSVALSSIDIWQNGTTKLHYEFDREMSLVKVLPMIADLMKRTQPGTLWFTLGESLNEDEIHGDETMLIEANSRTGDQIYDHIIDHFVSGEIINVDKISSVGSGYAIYNKIKKAYPAMFEKYSGDRRKTVFIGDPDFFVSSAKEVLEKIGRVRVKISKGSTKEDYTPSDDVIKLESDRERISYELQIEDLERLTRMVIAGVANALFVAGRGGIGKTFTVEKTLQSMGLTDGNGYFLNTGAASPAALYTLLHAHKKDIVFLDEADSVLKDQDARNLMKSATDTKKKRKLNWTKRSSSFVDPEVYDQMVEDNDGDPPENVWPKYFDFEGKIIFISNLDIDRLDPDGALRTRALMIEIDPTDEELIEFMRKISGNIKLQDGFSLTHDQQMEVIDYLAQSKSRASLSLRKLERSLNIRAGMGDDPRWQHYVKNYA